MRTSPLVAMTIVLLAAAAVAGGCASQGDRSDLENRASSAIQACRGHGGVSAFDDDAVICEDDTFNDGRGELAVEACRGHGGVSAFDDNIVICRDQSYHRAEGG